MSPQGTSKLPTQQCVSELYTAGNQDAIHSALKHSQFWDGMWLLIGSMQQCCTVEQFTRSWEVKPKPVLLGVKPNVLAFPIASGNALWARITQGLIFLYDFSQKTGQSLGYFRPENVVPWSISKGSVNTDWALCTIQVCNSLGQDVMKNCGINTDRVSRGKAYKLEQPPALSGSSVGSLLIVGSQDLSFTTH